MVDLSRGKQYTAYSVPIARRSEVFCGSSLVHLLSLSFSSWQTVKDCISFSGHHATKTKVLADVQVYSDSL